ncbi:aldehyde dehydrogenase family protein [Nocardioides hungaricus]
MRQLSNYIAGVREPGPGRWLDVENPATEEVIGRVPDSSSADADRAVEAARAAGEGFGGTSPADRSRLLERLADGLQRRQDEIADAITRDVGTPLRIATRIQAALPVTVTRSYAALAAEYPMEERIGNSLVVREPVGVTVAITPWNYPLHQIMCKVAPAVAAGATTVLKPSEVAPLVVELLLDVLEEADMPRGVVNVVHGSGPEVGEALVTHPGVDMVSFTGSGRAGTHVAELAARSVKRVTLELGGKSAHVILPDAELASAVKVGVANAFLNGGQTCTAWTRLLVPVERHEEALDLARQAAEGFTAGDPANPDTRLGPMVSAAQAERVRGAIRSAVADGARLVTGGVELPDGVERGHFVRPTVFGDVDPDSALAQEEVFGPVLAVIPYRDEDHALAIANNSRYGLHGSVWSADVDRATAFARRVRTGSIDVNGAAYNPMAPFGGYKQSGLGRELGRYGLEEYLETKSIQL